MCSFARPPLTFRAVRSRSVRSPNFGELYEAQSVRAGAVNDPCEIGRFDANPIRSANCRAHGFDGPAPQNGEVAMVTTGGNPDLKPETSNSFTVGMVFQPTFLRGLDLTIDYWNIKIDDIITQFSQDAVANMCFDLPTLDNDFCRQLTFDPDTRYILTLSTQQMNASTSITRGIDLGTTYRFPLGSGQFQVGAKGTFLLKKDVITVPGIESSTLSYDGAWTNPRVRATIFVNYDIGRASIGLDTRYISKSKWNKNVQSDEVYEDNSVPTRIYNDLSFRYSLTDNLSLTGGINNVFDVKPPYMPSTYLGLGYYDNVGRYFFTSVKAKF